MNGASFRTTPPCSKGKTGKNFLIAVANPINIPIYAGPTKDKKDKIPFEIDAAPGVEAFEMSCRSFALSDSKGSGGPRDWIIGRSAVNWNH